MTEGTVVTVDTNTHLKAIKEKRSEIFVANFFNKAVAQLETDIVCKGVEFVEIPLDYTESFRHSARAVRKMLRALVLANGMGYLYNKDTNNVKIYIRKAKGAEGEGEEEATAEGDAE